jgi:hypothetical protein
LEAVANHRPNICHHLNQTTLEGAAHKPRTALFAVYSVYLQPVYQGQAVSFLANSNAQSNRNKV